MRFSTIIAALQLLLLCPVTAASEETCPNCPRVIVTTDGEADDRASMMRFLLSSNEFDVEAIVNSSSQFHWLGGKGWNAFHPVEWVKEYIGYYEKVYPNLLKHDPGFPSPNHLLSKWRIGNIDAIGEYEKNTDGARFISEILLDDSDPRPIWVQAWGGCNTIAAALRIIQEEHPDEMEKVAGRIRLYLIWEQDETYQKYIRPNWEHFNIPTIISDQFDCMAYIWHKVLPAEIQSYFQKDWFSKNILVGKGPLCEAYPNNNGAFNGEGDTPAFLHSIDNGLRNMENPGYGGWGGRYVNVRNNVWMDPVPLDEFEHTTGQWCFKNSWSKQLENAATPELIAARTNYFRPLWQWMPAIQNDFAARASWCVKDYSSANHHPVVVVNVADDMTVRPGELLDIDATKSHDPDNDNIDIRWWLYPEAGSYKGDISLETNNGILRLTVPTDIKPGETIHLICEISDDGVPSLTRYKRIILNSD